MLKEKFAVDFGSKLVIYFLTACTGIIVARVAGPEVVGNISYATSYVSLFIFITGLFGTAHIKLMAENQNQDDCQKTFLILSLFSNIAFVLMVIGFFVYEKYFMNHEITSEQEQLICLSIAIAAFGNFAQFYQTLFVAKNEQAKSNLPEVLKTILYNIGRIVIVFLGFRAIGLSLVNLFGALIVLPIYIYLARGTGKGKFDNVLAKKYFNISLPIFFLILINGILAYSDKVILEYYSNTKEVGYYSAASSIGGMLILIGNTAGTVFFPVFSGLIARNEQKEVISKINKFEQFLILFCLPAIVTMFFYSKPIIVFLLGNKYAQSSDIFSALIISSFFIIWSMPYGNVLNGYGLFWLNSRINLFKLAIFITTLFVTLNPKILNMGSIGLGITQIILSIFIFVSNFTFSIKKLDMKINKKVSLIVFFWLIVCIGIKWFNFDVLEYTSPALSVLLLLPLTMIFIFFIFFIFKIIRNEDFKFLYEVINPRAALRYAKKEIKGN